MAAPLLPLNPAYRLKFKYRNVALAARDSFREMRSVEDEAPEAQCYQSAVVTKPDFRSDPELAQRYFN
jgi:hypothetical protein